METPNQNTYADRELDAKFTFIAAELLEIKEQTTYTNGKLRKVIVALIIVATATLTLLATNSSELAKFIISIVL